MSAVEAYTLNSTGGNSAPVPGVMGGRRHRRGTKKHHKLRLVKKRTVRKMLKKMGMRMRGGVDEAMTSATPATPATPATTTGGSASALAPGHLGGRKRRGGKTVAGRRRSHKKGLMGLF